jgi:uncharacterized repeat protein (TIGR03803 family)
MRSTILSAAAMAAVFAVAGICPAQATTNSIPYSFTGQADGGFPHGGVIADASGNLYGTASSDGADHSGVVYKLTAPAQGQTAWTQTTLYTFTGGADGATPYAGLFMDESGALYGTTYAGGGASGDGVVFKLTPPAQGQTNWTQTVLWSFTGGNDGGVPVCTLIQDSNGNLYGTTTLGGTGVVGTVFELSPPAQGKTAWTETVLYNFTGNNDGGEPFGNVLFGPNGALFGTSAGYGQYNYGTVYRLTPPKKHGHAWGFDLLHAFSGGADGEVPRDGLISDSSGTLYGTTAGFDNSQGSVFQLTSKNGKKWKEKNLYNFSGQGFTGNGPWATVSVDASGALYGTTLGVGDSANGEVFKLTPPKHARKAWTESVLMAFPGGAGSQFPYSTVLVGPNGTLFGTSTGSAGQNGFFPGNVWEITQ